MTESEYAPSVPVDEQLPLAARCVRGLLDRHGVRKYRQSVWLAEALGLSYSQAHRRMNGASPWTLEDLERVGALFGETLSEVVAKTDRGSVPGVVKVGTVTVACQLWLGEVDRMPQPGTLVAATGASGWMVMPASEVPEGATAYKVERFEAKPAAEGRRLIAVLDDDPDVTDGLCEQLRASGYEARGFYASADLRKACEERLFDAFVVDWIVEDKKTEDLLAMLRHQNGSAPIIVLTGQQLLGPDEDDLAHAVMSLGLVFGEKPVRVPILSATLARAFLAAQQRS